MAGRAKQVALAAGGLVAVAGLVVGLAAALGWHRAPDGVVEAGALAAPVTTDPTATEDPVVSAVLIGAVYPTVASVATIVPDGSGYTLRIRSQATVAADRVADALSRNRDGASPQVRTALAAVTEIATVDAGTVRIGLSRPDPDLPRALAGSAGAIVVSGLGPYRIASFAPGRSLILIRVRGSGPAEVRWHFYGDTDALRADLARGRIDLIAPAIDIALPGGARRVTGTTGPAIAAAVGAAHDGDRRIADLIRTLTTPTPAVTGSPMSARPAVVAAPDQPVVPALVVLATNEPDVYAAATALRRRLVAAGVPAKVSALPPDQWRQLVDAGSYDLAVGTGLPGQRIGTVRYSLIVSRRIAGTPRLGEGGAIDLSRLRVR